MEHCLVGQGLRDTAVRLVVVMKEVLVAGFEEEGSLPVDTSLPRKRLGTEGA